MQSPVLTALVALAAGIAGGVAGALVGAPTPDGPREVGTGPSRRAVPSAGGDLEEQIAALRARLDSLDAGALPPDAAAPARVPADGDTRSRLDRLEAELDELALRVDALSIRSRPTTEAVADAIEELEKERRVAKAEAELGRDRESIDERVTAWADWLDLDTVQTERLRTAFLAQSERDNELLLSWAAGTDEDAIRDMKRQNAEIHVQEIEQILNPDQLARFREKRGGGKD